jgi:CelD/BcsL family acetyltransferase involved in cellulose biosynthesis
MQGLQALRPCYEQLQRETGNILPFAMHDWHVAWCGRFLNNNARTHDQLHFYVMRDADGKCVCVLPFIISRRRVGPLSVPTINFVGADTNVTEIRTPLMVPGYEDAIALAVQSQLAQMDGWDWVHWIGISDAFGDALSKHCTLFWQPEQPTFVLDLAATWEQFRSGLKRNIRESLRHCYNSLKRDKHAFDFKIIEAGPEVAPGVERFLELHGMRAEVHVGVQHPNRFWNPMLRDFLREVCQRFADAGALRLFQLKIGSEVVAMWVGLASGDCIFFYSSGFDPAWSRYSVMTTTLAEAIKYAIGQGFKSVHLSAGKDVAKTRWGPREVIHKAAYQHAKRLRSRIALLTYIKARASDGLLAKVLHRVGQIRPAWRPSR